jgi:hypothetical protein
MKNKKYEIGAVSIFAEVLEADVRYQAAALNHECEGDSVSECLHKLAGKIAELDHQDKPIKVTDVAVERGGCENRGELVVSSPDSDTELLSLEALVGSLGDAGDESFLAMCEIDPGFSYRATSQLPMILAWMTGVCRRTMEQAGHPDANVDVDPFFPIGIAILQALGMNASQITKFGKSPIDDVLSMTPVSAKASQA